ncbi:MAG: Fic family protein [Nitrosomonadales bacterium]|nr:Fic family protein [Nitrosomonadales bacterium]
MNAPSNCDLRVETRRSGPFTFQIGTDLAALKLAMQRVEDAHERFAASPLSQVANRLEHEVVVSSIFGTNTIEGGALSEEETGAALQLDPAQVQEIEQRRALNIKAAYDHARQAVSAKGWRLNLDFICKIHAAITHQLPHPHDQPGVFRNNPKSLTTFVGNEAHGGRYKPPQHSNDIKLLMGKLIEWHDALETAGISPLIRAPLVHLYYELIHPFWDGNGRVGRVLEASLLQAAGYRYAPFAMARHYLDNIDVYFTLFNTCRKAADKRQSEPNTPFIAFHIEGMRVVINKLHDRVNRIVAVLLFETQIKQLLDRKEINSRQYTLLSQLLTRGKPMPLEEIRQAPWYGSLYLKRNDKTRQRDLQKLRAQELVFLDDENRLWPGFIRPQQVKSIGK